MSRMSNSEIGFILTPIELDKLEGCGSCHQHGNDSPIQDGVCRICERSIDEIINEHGSLRFDKAKSKDLK